MSAYLDAWLFNKRDNEFALECVRDIATYITSGPLTHKEGGYYSAEDADSIAPDNAFKKREGAYYVWTYEEFFKVLGRIPGDVAAAHWGVSEYGNVDAKFDLHGELEGMNVLSVVMDIPELSRVFGMTEEVALQTIEKCKVELREFREANRPAPEVDDKIVAGWNGLAMGALARAGAAIMENDAASGGAWLESAKRTAKLLREKMYDAETGRLWRVYCAEETGETPGMCEDYAYVISGLLDLYGATFDVDYLKWAQQLQETQNSLFWDSEESGFYSAMEENSGELILRMKSGADTVEPSSNAVSVSNLMKLAAVLEEDEYEQMALRTLDAYAKDILTQPYAYCGILGSVVAGSEGMRTVVIVGRTKEDIQAMITGVRSVLLPNTALVVLQGHFTPEDADAESKQNWLVGHSEIYEVLLERDSHAAVAYICQERTCGAPITDAGELVRVLEDSVQNPAE